jgi:hypothetical protein
MDTYLTIAASVLRRTRLPMSAKSILNFAYRHELAWKIQEGRRV